MRVDKYYMESDGSLTPVQDNMQAFLRWADWFEKADRTVGKTTIDGFLISTVFLGYNHSFEDGPPLVFETMVFDTTSDQVGNDIISARYSSFEEAKVGHEEICAVVRLALFAIIDGKTKAEMIPIAYNSTMGRKKALPQGEETHDDQT